jgi:peptidoglycan hydrolase-like protein with peptidoglycan-binding domain
VSVRLVFTVVIGLAAALFAAGPATAAGKPASGSLTGYAFDTCSAPSQAVMDAWWQNSPYAGVGIYIGGSNRQCDQPQLSAGWVRTQQRRGWHVLPIFVGPQASCTGFADRMSSDLAVAEKQGRQQAAIAVRAARSLGIKARSTIFYDLEDYDIAPDDCRRAALSFVSGWTKTLHAAKYGSGVYSNIAAAITSLDFADRVDHGHYAMPDEIWFAWANGRADTRTDDRVQGHRWDDHARVHQYVVDTTQRYGGYSMVVDGNWVDTGAGSVAPREKQLCRGVDVDLRSYPRLALGKQGPAVRAAQCLLRRQHFTKAAISGHYDRHAVAAVKKAQKRLGQKVTGKLTRPTLLARGSEPVLKVGSTGEPVRRLQRALVAVGKHTPIDGVFTKKTARAIAGYQRKAGLPATGVVTAAVWDGFGH